MDIKEEQICRLCLKVAESDYEIIDDTKKKMFEALLLQVNLDISEDPIVCKVCTDISTKCFNFKSACIDREGFIFTSVTKINESKDEKCIKFIDANLSCRFCSHLLSDDNCISLDTLKNNNTFAEMLQRLMPEMDFNTIENPVTCTSCLEDLERYMKFAESCLDIEKEITRYCRNAATTSSVQIKLSDLVRFVFKNSSELDHAQIYTIKKEDIEDVYDSVITDIKAEGNFDEKTSTTNNLFKCDVCSFQTKHKRNLKRRTLIHNDATEIKMYDCPTCPYKTKQKNRLVVHSLVHKNVTEVEMYKCSTCNFQTKHKLSLKTHTLIHKDVSKIDWHKCTKCTYKAKRKSHLQCHTLTHRDVTEVETYKCPSCTFQTKHQRSLASHKLTHDHSKAKMHKCPTCTYETIRKYDLKTHTLVHKDVSETEIYKCTLCSFQTKYKSNFKAHTATHKSVTELALHKCPTCNFRAKRKGNLKIHTLVHKNKSELELYKCGLCPFQTKYKNCLKIHLKKC